MRSRPLRARPLPWLLLSMAPVVTGCAATTPMPTIPAALDCAAVIPPSYRKPVAGTPLPPADAVAGDLWSALDAQTARLDQANGRTADVIAMADACQTHQAKVIATLAAPRPWWRFWS